MMIADKILVHIKSIINPGNQPVLNDKIHKAVDLSHSVHNSIEHLLQMSYIAASEIGLGYIAIVGSIVKDVPDEEVEKEFGTEVLQIKKGLNKVDELNTKQLFDKQEEENESLKVKRKRYLTTEKKRKIQAENYSKLLLAISGDVRVILLFMAQRLHEVRNIKSLPNADQIKLSMEVGELLAPIAHKLGLYDVKTEMEEVSMKYNQPEIYKYIARKLDDTKAKRNLFIEQFIYPLKRILKQKGFQCEIKGRPKSISSIWNKLKNKNAEFEQIYDLFAIRIILDDKFNTLEQEKEACWKVYSIISDIYEPNPNRLRDWISVPKSSGYESLHTTVLCKEPEMRWVEVQIRTRRMDTVAEKGSAAHWKYKEVAANHNHDIWLSKIRSLLESPSVDALDSSDQAKMKLYSDKIFVFTPGGQLLTLPAKATVLDFAYAVHTDLGSTCVGGKINNRVQPLKYELNNGDRIEILTSKNQKPKKEWINFCSSQRTKSKIKRALKVEENKLASEGKTTVRDILTEYKQDMNDKFVAQCMNHFGYNSFINFYGAVGRNEIPFREYIDSLFNKDIQEETEILKQIEEKKKEISTKKQDDFLVIGNQKNIDFQLAKCCNPIPGDSVFGFVSITKGTKIHKVNCPNAQDMMTRYPYRIVPVKWRSADLPTLFPTTIHIIGINAPGMLASVVNVISNDMRLNMGDVHSDSKPDVFDARITVFIYNTKHLDDLIGKIKEIKGIQTVERIVQKQ